MTENATRPTPTEEQVTSALQHLKMIAESDKSDAQKFRVPAGALRAIALRIKTLEDVGDNAAVEALENAGFDDLEYEVDCLRVKLEETRRAVHPNYGDCDELGPDGRCTECTRLVEFNLSRGRWQ